MLFSDELIENIDKNPVGSITEVCRIVIDTLEESPPRDYFTHDEFEMLMEGAALIETIIDSNGLFTDYAISELSGSMEQNCSMLGQYIRSINQDFQAHATQLKMESYKNKYKTALKATFSYEFSQGDLERVQSLINELRENISQVTGLEENHKRRLLKRLEKLQSELHKRVSDLDVFWGMIGDAGVVLGKLGQDSKPIVDRIKEISEIVWKTQARTEELPSSSPSPLLGNKE